MGTVQVVSKCSCEVSWMVAETATGVDARILVGGDCKKTKFFVAESGEGEAYNRLGRTNRGHVVVDW